MSEKIMRLIGVGALALATLAFASPSTANAQFGGLVKKAVKKAAGEAAVDAATDKARQKIAPHTESSGNAALGAELTADTLDLVLKGLAATATKLEQIDGLSKRRDDLNAKLQENRTANYATVERYNEQESKIGACISDHINGLNKSRENELRAKMMTMMATPNGQQGWVAEYQKVMQDMAAAQAKGDTTGMNKALAGFYKKVLGVDVKADTVAAQKQCGTLPRKPAAIAEQAALDAQVDSANVQIRAAEAQASTAGENASGLPSARYLQARERLTTWLGADKQGKALQYFSDHENKLLVSRKGDIERVERALR